MTCAEMIANLSQFPPEQEVFIFCYSGDPLERYEVEKVMLAYDAPVLGIGIKGIRNVDFQAFRDLLEGFYAKGEDCSAMLWELSARGAAEGAGTQQPEVRGGGDL